MKGKYITTSLIIAVLSGGKNGPSVLFDETAAVTEDHTLIWSKTVNAVKTAMNKQQPAEKAKLVQ